MSVDLQTNSERVLWINHAKRIISFEKIKGFQIMVFSTREEKIAYAFQKASSGYRIQ